MYPERIPEPVPIAAPRFVAAEPDAAARVAIAVYLLMAGPLFVGGVEPDDTDRSLLPPAADLAAMNVRIGRARRRPSRTLQAPAPSDPPPTAGELAALVAEANATGDAEVAARAVALGTRSDDELIRVCALGSAVEFFDPAGLDLPGQVAWVLRHATQDQTRELMATLLSRLVRAPAVASPPTASAPFAAGPCPGLMAVHGTVLPGSRPVWSVPATGPLFAHLQAVRPDIYDGSDFFRWEGGYSDYAREVAAESLASWQRARGLAGIDLVAHSHGCNVAMAATRRGAAFGRMVLLSCPVHWPKYALSPVGPGVVSVRIHADAMILMDRGGQRFPPGTIPDVVLPLWYTGHGATNDPATWMRERLDRFIV